jgi:hypothetical protein
MPGIGVVRAGTCRSWSASMQYAVSVPPYAQPVSMLAK